MYAVLVMRREWKLLARGPDGRWTSDLEQERADFLRMQRASAAAHHEAVVREHEAALDAARRAQDDRRSWETTSATRLKRFVERSRIEPLPRERGFVRVTTPSGETFECRRENADSLIENQFKRADPPPAIASATEPPAMPSDDELLQGFAADREARKILHWSGRLTTQEGDSDLGWAPADHLGGGLPPRFVTQTLNALAADGWAVDHVGEDHAMINESAEVVRVRYLLSRS